jgi:hypothetical protein
MAIFHYVSAPTFWWWTCLFDVCVIATLYFVFLFLRYGFNDILTTFQFETLNLFLRFCFNVFVLTEFHFVPAPTFWWWWRWTGTWPSASRWPTRPGPPPSQSRWLHLLSEGFTIGCQSNSHNKCLIKMKQPFYFFYLNKLPNVQDAPIVKTFLLSCQSNSRYKCLIKWNNPFTVST